MNIVEPIYAQCRNKPADLALCAPGTQFNLMSYGRLERSADNVCRRLLSAGIKPRHRVAVFIDDPIFHSIVLIALMKVGAVTISGCKRNFSWRFVVDAIVTDRQQDFSAARVIVAQFDWTTSKGTSERVHFYNPALDDISRIFLAPMDAGEEKGIAVTNRMVIAGIERLKLFLGRRAPFCARTYLDQRLATPLGFQVFLATLWRGGALIMPGQPEKTIEALPIYQVQNIVASAQSLPDFVTAIEHRRCSQCQLEAVFCLNGGPEDLWQRTHSRICPNLTVGYLAMDTTMVASMPAHFATRNPGAVGFVLPGVSVEIVDNEGRALPAGIEGKLRISTNYGIAQVLEDRSETQRGGVCSSDRGYLTDDNMLVISSQAESAKP
jgi:acyl-coenzyme A synthetase/AMP-(fatty) acid ligase